MKKSILMLFLFVPFATIAQVKKATATSSAPPILSIIERDALQFEINTLVKSEHKDLEYVNSQFEKEILSPKTNAILKNNKVVFRKFLSNIDNISEAQSAFFDTQGSGLGIFSFNNLKTISFRGLIYSYSLNTLKLDASERANKVAREVLLPGLAEFKPLLELKDISYYSLMAGYVARDFGKDEDSSIYKDGETLTIIISKSVLKKYLNAEITDEDVFKAASFFNSNKATKGIRKITIK